MSDEEDDIEEDEEGEDGEEESGGGKKKLFLIIGIAVVVLLGGGGAGAYFMGFFGGGEHKAEEVVVIPAGPPVYHEFPQLVVDLKKKGNRTNYIKLKVVVEIVTRDLPLLVAQELKIVDKMQGYLRSQTRDDVAGGPGTENMRNGISKIVTDVMGDVKIEGVLCREILLQ